MHRDGEADQKGSKVAEDLEPYRRLIELQKQMIELSQQHEQAKRERDTLREEVAREVADHVRARKSLRHRIQRSAVKLLRRWRLSQGANPAQFPTRIGTTPSASN